MEIACKKALNEFENQVVRATLNKNWRIAWYTIQKANETLHICQGDEDMDLVVSDVVVKLSKLLTGYIITDTQLYGEYLVKAIFYHYNIDTVFQEIQTYIDKENKGDVVDIDEIKKIVLKLLSAVHSYITSPY